MNKYAFADDSQIVELIGTKVWGIDEYVEVEIEEV